MRKVMLAAAAATVLAGLTSPSFSMGGSSGGDYSSGMSSAPQMSDYGIALRLIRHEKYSEALPHLMVALADRPNDPDILNYIGYAKRMTGDLDGSQAYYQRALAIKPDHRGVHEYLGELYLMKNDPASAQKELDTLASLCPDGCDERDTLQKAIAGYVPVAAVPAASN
jgi:predicted Zn-dependent protease